MEYLTSFFGLKGLLQSGGYFTVPPPPSNNIGGLGYAMMFGRLGALNTFFTYYTFNL